MSKLKSSHDSWFAVFPLTGEDGDNVEGESFRLKSAYTRHEQRRKEKQVAEGIETCLACPLAGCVGVKKNGCLLHMK